MYRIQKRMEVAGAHKLELPYESKCKQLHGHNWIVVVYCEASELNPQGMVVDFKHIKRAIHDKFDHTYVNDVLAELGKPQNPTAENMARVFCELVNKAIAGTSVARCYRVDVQESEGNTASYIVPVIDRLMD